MNGVEMMQAFHYVRDVYANVSRMLQSADPIMNERGYSPYIWDAIWPWTQKNAGRAQTNIASFDLWMPTFVVRQFYGPERRDREIFTLGAVLWAWPSDTRPLQEPIAIASRMYVTGTPDDVYKFGIAQRWAAGAPIDGRVRNISAADIAFTPGDRESFDKIVVGGRLTTAAVPLVTITNSDELDTLIKTVLSEPMPWLPIQ